MKRAKHGEDRTKRREEIEGNKSNPCFARHSDRDTKRETTTNNTLLPGPLKGFSRHPKVAVEILLGCENARLETVSHETPLVPRFLFPPSPTNCHPRQVSVHFHRYKTTKDFNAIRRANKRGRSSFVTRRCCGELRKRKFEIIVCFLNICR